MEKHLGLVKFHKRVKKAMDCETKSRQNKSRPIGKYQDARLQVIGVIQSYNIFMF